jgi:Golgi nucleoside diphosphatase
LKAGRTSWWESLRASMTVLQGSQTHPFGPDITYMQPNTRSNPRIGETGNGDRLYTKTYLKACLLKAMDSSPEAMMDSKPVLLKQDLR